MNDCALVLVMIGKDDAEDGNTDTAPRDEKDCDNADVDEKAAAYDENDDEGEYAVF